jgi:threonine dehydrogenase-like Zn-dependent dehydrogenase
LPEQHEDDRFLFLSDVLPTAWQGLKYAALPDDGTLLVLGAGPIGDMVARMGVRAGHRVISVDRVPERLERVRNFGAEALNLDDADQADSGVAAMVRDLTGDPIPMFQLFDKQIQVRMGQANVRAWTDELLGMLTEDDPFGVDSFATHHLPLGEAPEAYRKFQKEDGMVKMVFKP